MPNNNTVEKQFHLLSSELSNKFDTLNDTLKQLTQHITTQPTFYTYSEPNTAQRDSFTYAKVSTTKAEYMSPRGHTWLELDIEGTGQRTSSQQSKTTNFSVNNPVEQTYNIPRRQEARRPKPPEPSVLSPNYMTETLPYSQETCRLTSAKPSAPKRRKFRGVIRKQAKSYLITGIDPDIAGQD